MNGQVVKCSLLLLRRAKYFGMGIFSKFFIIFIVWFEIRNTKIRENRNQHITNYKIYHKVEAEEPKIFTCVPVYTLKP